MSHRYNWPALDPLWQALFAAGPPPPGALHAFATAHDVPPVVLRVRVRRLREQGMALPSPRPRWTPAEAAYLAAHYLQGVPYCAARLGRTERAVRHQLAGLGLSYRAEYHLTDLATALGCGVSTVSDWRRLPPPRTLRAVGEGHLTDSALHRFLCEQGALWRKYPCPDRAWIESLLTDKRLRTAHGCMPQAREGEL